MAMIAVHVDAVEEICAHYLTRKRRELKRNQEVLIGKTMNPSGWRSLLAKPCTREQAIARLSKPGKPLDQLQQEWLRTYKFAGQIEQEACAITAYVQLHRGSVPYRPFSHEEAKEFGLELDIFRKAVVRAVA